MFNLPNEIYICLTPFLDIRSLANFSLANKTIHSLCTPCLDNHKELHLKWANINDPNDQKKQIHVTKVLIAFLSDPRIAWYILGYTFGPNSSHEGWPSKRREKPRVPLLRDLIHSSSTLSDDMRPNWLSALDQADEEDCSRPLEALLVAMLPNLRTLRFPTKKGLDFFTDMLPAEKSFSNVKNIELGYWQDYGINADFVMSLMQLPSLERFHGSNIVSCDNNYDHDYESPVRTENTCPLVDLSFWGGITAGCLAEMLRGIRNEDGYGLQRFIYDKDVVDSEYSTDNFDGPSLLQALAQYASHSLVILELQPTELYYKIYLKEDEREEFEKRDQKVAIALGPDLSRLNHLRILRIPCEMLVNEDWLFEEKKEKTDRMSENELPLAGILPSSLQLLSLTSDTFFEYASDVVLQKLVVLLRDSFASVPGLKAIELSFNASNSSCLNELTSICKERGVQLGLGGMGLYKTYSGQVKIGVRTDL